LEIETLKDSLRNIKAELSDAQAKLASDKLKAEEEISSLRLELAETKEAASQDADLASSEIKKLKVRCDVLWETISERRSPIIPSLPVEDAREESKHPVQTPLEPNSKPAEIPQDASSVIPPTLEGKGPENLQEPELVQKTEDDIQRPDPISSDAHTSTANPLEMEGSGEGREVVKVPEKQPSVTSGDLKKKKASRQPPTASRRDLQKPPGGPSAASWGDAKPEEKPVGRSWGLGDVEKPVDHRPSSWGFLGALRDVEKPPGRSPWGDAKEIADKREPAGWE